MGFFFQWWLEEWTFFLNKGVWFFLFLNHFLAYLFWESSVQCCCRIHFAIECGIWMNLPRRAVWSLRCEQGVFSHLCQQPTGSESSQGSFLPNVPVNRNKPGLGSNKSLTEAPFPYCFPHSPFCAVVIPLVLQSPLSLPGHRRLEYLMRSSKGFWGKKAE